MWKSESFKAAKVSETSGDQLSKYQLHMLACLGTKLRCRHYKSCYLYTIRNAQLVLLEYLYHTAFLSLSKLSNNSNTKLFS